MKKILLAIAALALLTAACNAGENGDSAQQQPEMSAGESSLEPVGQDFPDAEELETPTPELPVVAGAALYRGEVESLEVTEEGFTVVLRQVEGTDFGRESLRVAVLEDTAHMSFADPEIGNYLEVYYGAPMGGPIPEEVSAIQLNRLPDADLCLYVGHIEELEPENSRLLLRGENGAAVLVQYGDDSQIYLNLDELVVGDRLSVYTNGVATRSMPPQVFALELRLLG